MGSLILENQSTKLHSKGVALHHLSSPQLVHWVPPVLQGHNLHCHYFDKSDEHFGTDWTHHKAFCNSNVDINASTADTNDDPAGHADDMIPNLIHAASNDPSCDCHKVQELFGYIVMIQESISTMPSIYMHTNQTGLFLVGTAE